MIDRFNFYDIYGNLIPGFVLVALFALPHYILAGAWPSADLGSAVLVIVVAYLFGHLLQSIATSALSSQVMRDAGGRPAFPSIVLLDKSNKVLSTSLKTRLADLVRSQFGINLHIDLDLDADVPQHRTIAADRNTAFFLCRPLANKTSAYTEQFQGLYAMSRGLFVAFSLGSLYLIGAWLPAPYTFFALGVAGATSMVALFLAILRLFDLPRLRFPGLRISPLTGVGVDRAILAVVGALALASGGVAWGLPSRDDRFDAATLAVAGVSLFFALRFLLLYRLFSVEFAKAVWTYFSVSKPQIDAA